MLVEDFAPEAGELSFQEEAKLWKEQYHPQLIERSYNRFGGLAWFTNSWANSFQQVGNSLHFRFKDRVTTDSIGVTKAETFEGDPSCPTVVDPGCPAPTFTGATYTDCVMNLTHNYSWGTKYCKANEVFKPYEKRAEMEGQIKAARERFAVDVWTSLIESNKEANLETLLPEHVGNIPNHYWIPDPTTSIHEILLCATQYLSDLWGSELSQFTAFVPSLVEKKMLGKDSDFHCYSGTGQKTEWFNSKAISPTEMSLIFPDFHGLSMVKAPTGVLGSSVTNPFYDGDKAYIVIAAQDSFAFKFMQIVNNEYSASTCDSFEECVKNLAKAGCKNLLPDRVMIIEVTC